MSKKEPFLREGVKKNTIICTTTQTCKKLPYMGNWVGWEKVRMKKRWGVDPAGKEKRRWPIPMKMENFDLKGSRKKEKLH